MDRDTGNGLPLPPPATIMLRVAVADIDGTCLWADVGCCSRRKSTVTNIGTRK